jgi:hypothetical protein
MRDTADNATAERMLAGRIDSGREKEEILTALVDMAQRVYFTMTTLYFMTAVEATGHMSETDEHVKTSGASLSAAGILM